MKHITPFLLCCACPVLVALEASASEMSPHLPKVFCADPQALVMAKARD